MGYINIRVRLSAIALVAASLALVSGLPAGAADKQNVRGAVTAVDGSNVRIKTREGKDVSLDLADGWAINGVTTASMTDIKQGTFIGTATLPDAAEGMKAIEVVVFPEKLRGTGEGHYPWDLKPKSSMTNATVSKSVQAVDGQTVTLSYKGGEKKVTIGADTPIVQIVDATKADLAPGAPVFIVTPGEADGKLGKGFLIVGMNGVQPPM